MDMQESGAKSADRTMQDAGFTASSKSEATDKVGRGAVQAADRRAGSAVLPADSSRDLYNMYLAGQEILKCFRVLNKAGMNVVGEVLRDALNHGETFLEYIHYPRNDVYDRETHAQYYYHSHRSNACEHGHFHCFLRSPGMPPDARPLEHPSAARLWPQGDDSISHLVAIEMNVYGYPAGLFTVNRWVTGETWYPAEQVIRMLDRFVIDHAYPSWPVNRWISAMFVLYRHQIESLLLQRDAAIRDWADRYPQRDVFEDRALEITSHVPISVDRMIDGVMRAISTVPGLSGRPAGAENQADSDRM
jgi:hypothetical protein